MLYRYIKPSQNLAPYVECYVVFEEEKHLAGKKLRTVSNGTTEIAVHYGGACESYINHPGEVNRGYIYGPHNAPGYFTASGPVKCLCILFKPLGFFNLTGFPQEELRDHAVDLDLLFGALARDFIHAVRSAESPEAKTAAAEKFLTACLKQSKKRDSRIDGLPELIRMTGGTMKIKDLSGVYGYTVKTLERNFLHSLGFKPKEYSKIARFNTVFKLLRQKAEINWAAAAQSFGYYDQSHMINDFKEFVQVPPQTLSRELDTRLLYVNRIYSFAPESAT